MPALLIVDLRMRTFWALPDGWISRLTEMSPSILRLWLRSYSLVQQSCSSVALRAKTRSMASCRSGLTPPSGDAVSPPPLPSPAAVVVCCRCSPELPAQPASISAPTMTMPRCMRMPPSLLEQVARNHEALDLARALVDLRDLRVAVVALDG